jgi:hypothetical protein
MNQRRPLLGAGHALRLLDQMLVKIDRRAHAASSVMHQSYIN